MISRLERVGMRVAQDPNCPPFLEARMSAANKVYLAIIALLSAAALEGCSAQVAALKRAEAKSRGATEPCFGIARSGKNDCKTHAHVCAGWSRRDGDPGAFVYVPAGTCERIVGGHLEES
jgi:uncharacterized membrane protein